MLLRRQMDAQNDGSRQRSAHGLQRRPAVRYPGTHSRHRQSFDDNNTPSQVSTDAFPAESKASGHISTEVYQNSSGESYVEKQREAQKVHTRAHPGDISSLLKPQPSRGSHKEKKSLFRGRRGSDYPYRRRGLLRKMPAPMRRRRTASGDEPAFYLENEHSLTTPPNWPFGVSATSGRNNVNRKAQHQPLTHREIRLVLRNPHIRDGNMGPLPVPDGLTPPRPPPHVYGTNPGLQKTGAWGSLTIPGLTGLKRRNAQRRKSPKSKLQNNFESYNDRFNSRFRRGSAARDVHVKYASPLERALHHAPGKTVLSPILEASHEPPHNASAQKSTSERPDAPKDDADGGNLLEHSQHREGEAEAPQKDESPERPSQTAEEQDEPSGQKTQHRNDANETPSTSARLHPSPRRFPLVVKGPRPIPTSLSTSSSAPSTPPSSAPPTAAATQAHTPASEPEPEPEPEPKCAAHSARDGPGCSAAGCTWEDCSRVRGTFRMPLPGAAGGSSRPEDVGGGGGSSSSAAQKGSEDDIVSVGNGFSFLRLN